MKIVFTGGGTAGHVNPNIALIEALQKKHWTIHYIGSKNSIEERMITARNIPFHTVRSGKLRRYFSWKNFVDPLNLIIGVIQSFFKIHQLNPDVVFSKGGFVALPVVIGAWLNRIPVISHESDLTPGLANRLSLPFIHTLCVTFAGTQKLIKKSNIQVTGTPIREFLLQGQASEGLKLAHLDDSKPCVLVMGGSLGARAINGCIYQMLPDLLKLFNVIHLCGAGNLNPSLNATPGYAQFEYVHEELAHFIAASHIIISRAGANALYEILACKKLHVLIPLSTAASRGDQIHNARYFEQQGISVVITESELTPELLLAKLKEVQHRQKEIQTKIEALGIQSATNAVLKLITSVIDKTPLNP